MPAEGTGHTFVSLFAGPRGEQARRLVEAGIDPDARPLVRCARPPLAGAAFLAAGGEMARMLDVWWQANVRGGSVPVVLLLHEPELDTWIHGLDAEFVIGVADEEERGLYAALGNVQTVLTQDPQVVTEYAMQRYAGFRPDFVYSGWWDEWGRRREGEGAAAERTPPPTPFVPRPSQRTQKTPPPRPAHGAPPATPPPLVGQVSGPVGHADESAAAPRRGLDFRSLVGRATRMLSSGDRISVVPSELTTLALSHRTGKIVGVTSRAGGVGKTAIAAGIGIIYGEAVQDSGSCAAVVDQNIGNPDQWGRLAVAGTARTVSEIMADVEAGREWTVPAWNRTPALAVYPERRDVGDGYAPGQIARFAAQLRQLHMLTVVDLPNRVPAFTSAEAAVCAGWISVADLVLIPTTDDPNRLLGTLEFLDAPLVRGDPEVGRPPVKVIVPYIRSPLRAIREHSRVLSLLDRVRQRVLAVVEIPKDEKATLAVVEGRPITEIDAGLRDAYIQLALVAARALLDP